MLLMKLSLPYSIFSLGDSALTIDFGNVIDKDINNYVLDLFHHLKKKNIPGVLDLVPAYSSLSIHYHVPIIRQSVIEKTVFEFLKQTIEKELEQDFLQQKRQQRKIGIPVCYSGSFAPDIEAIAIEKNISVEKLIQLHKDQLYSIYMIGFLPGFPYMGEVNDAIAVPRKTEPRTNVPAGSVGIAGKQTGIYPIDSPGGWEIIGRTPLKIFDKEKSDPVLLQPGDEIQFYSITEDEFKNY
jgi:inhibitor of KinA